MPPHSATAISLFAAVGCQLGLAAVSQLSIGTAWLTATLLLRCATDIALDGYPRMMLSGYQFLIYDSHSVRTERLKESLMREGATVHVTGSIFTALKLSEELDVHTVFVPFRADPATQLLCEQLDRMGVRKIFTGSSPKADALRFAA